MRHEYSKGMDAARRHPDYALNEFQLPEDITDVISAVTDQS
jgi:hypothetical protein